MRCARFRRVADRGCAHRVDGLEGHGRRRWFGRPGRVEGPTDLGVTALVDPTIDELFMDGGLLTVESTANLDNGDLLPITGMAFAPGPIEITACLANVERAQTEPAPATSPPTPWRRWTAKARSRSPIRPWKRC